MVLENETSKKEQGKSTDKGAAKSSKQTLEALKEIKLPSVSSFGEKSPDKSTIEKYKNLSNLGIGDLRGRSSDTVIYSERQLANQTPGAKHSSLLMDTNNDNKVTLQELAEFNYRSDMAGNRDGSTSVFEYNQMMGLGHADYISLQGTTSGLSKDRQAVLDARLATGQYGITGERGLPDAIDLGQVDKSDLARVIKVTAFSSSFDKAMKLATKEQKPLLAKAMLEHFADTGSTLQVLGKNENGNIVFASDTLIASKVSDGVTGYVARSSTYEFVLSKDGKSGELKHIEDQQGVSKLEIRDPSTYTFSSTQDNPALSSAIDRVSKKFKTDEVLAKSIKEFREKLVKAIDNPKLMKELLEPIHQRLQAAIGVEPKVELNVASISADGPLELRMANRGSYAHPQPGSGLEPKLSVFLTPRVNEATQEARLQIRRGVKPEQAMEQLQVNLSNGILSTLIEENFHAYQHQQVDLYNNNPQAVSQSIRSRVKDYSLNRATLVDPANLSAFFGNERFYSDQPIEVDAKRFSQAILKSVSR